MVSSLLAAPVNAQIFDSGPSNPASFDNVFNLPGDSFNSSAGGSTQLNVFDGGTIGSGGFTINGIELNVSGGNVGSGGFTARLSELNISGGDVGSGGFRLGNDSVLNLSGGEAGSGGFFVESGGVANVSGGEAGSGGLIVESGGVLNLSGGEAGSGGLTVESGGVLNLSGGEAGSGGFTVESGGVLNFSGGGSGGSGGFGTSSGSQVNIFGTEFFLQGSPLVLTDGVPFTINDLGVNLTGTLLDGESFNIFLGASNTATFTVSQPVPEPSSLIVFAFSGAMLLARRRKA